nr:MAG TPA_asm: helix-turn-helix domain protein [Caudoviricetes sp.]
MTSQPQDGPLIPVWTLGDRLRKAREAAGLDQTGMARRLGVSRGTVSNAERETVTPRRSVVMAWALATRVPLDWIEGKENPRPDGPDGGEGLPRLDLNQQPTGACRRMICEHGHMDDRAA